MSCDTLCSTAVHLMQHGWQVSKNTPSTIIYKCLYDSAVAPGCMSPMMLHRPGHPAMRPARHARHGAYVEVNIPYFAPVKSRMCTSGSTSSLQCPCFVVVSCYCCCLTLC